MHGNRLTTTNALGKVWTSTYDAGGRVLTVTDPLTHVTTNTYNNRNQVADGIEYRTAADAVVSTVTYGYDTANRRISMTDALGTTNYAYDNADRLHP